MDVVKSISILIVLFYTSESYDVYVDNGDTLPLTCILPAIKHADKVVLLKGNKKNNTYRLDFPITNAGLGTVCYCGDPDKNYTFLIGNASKEYEGRFKCIFYLAKNETHRHTIRVAVSPKVETYWYTREKHVYYICNITRPAIANELRVYMVVGGINITHWFLREFGSTATNLVVGVSADTNYEDWAKQAICGVIYHNNVKEYKIHMDSVYDLLKEDEGSASGINDLLKEDEGSASGINDLKEDEGSASGINDLKEDEGSGMIISKNE